MPFALPCFQGWLWSDGGRGTAHTPCVLGCRLQLWLQSQAVPAPLSLTQPCGPAGWQTCCHPHLQLCPSKPALVWGVGFSGQHCTSALAVHLFLPPRLIFLADILLYVGNSFVVPDFPQLEMIRGKSPTTVTFWFDPGHMSSLFMSERGSFPHLGAETNILLLISFNHI